MNKSWSVLVFIVILVMVTLGCAAPAPTPAPVPTSPQTPAAQKPAAKEHEEVSIEILGAGRGGRGYVLAAVMADVINKYGPPWLHTTSSATRGTTENILLTAKDKEARTKSLLYTSDMAMNAAELARWDFKEKISGLKVLATTSIGGSGLATINPKIRKWSDLAGKRVATDKAGAGKQLYFADFLPKQASL